LKLFSKKLLLKYILFGEKCFLFSLLSAFLAIHILNLNKSDRQTLISGSNRSTINHIVKNYRILDYFLNKITIIPEFQNPKNKKSKNKSQNQQINNLLSKKEFINKTLLQDFLTQKKAEILLEEKKFRQAEKTISKLNSKYDFIAYQKNKLILNSLYSQKRFKPFVDHYNHFPQNHPKLKVFFVYSLIRTKKTQKAFEIFRELFKKNRISLFKEILPAQTLRSFINKLDFTYWFEKFRYLAKDNAFTEIFSMRKYLKFPQLFFLFNAEYYYKKKSYSRAENLLKKVGLEELSNYKNRLAFKIKLRKTEKNFNSIIGTINKFKKADEIFPDLLFNSASILILKEQYNLALKLYSQYINSEFNRNNPNYWKALWYSAWLSFRNNNKREALEFFKKGADSPIMGYRIANRYWAFQLEDENNNELEKYPFSYYFIKIHKPGNKSAQSFLNPFLNLINQEQSSLFLDIVNVLNSLTKYQLFKESLQLIKISKHSSTLSESDLNMLKIIESLLYLKKQDYYQAFTSFKNNFSYYQCIYLPRFLSQIYLPVRHEKLAKKYGKKHKIDPFLILALIREESFFKIDAVSRARAYGLMQLLLRTAKAVALQSGEKISKRDLFKPESNIRFGTEYLKYLIDKYNGKIHFALAAYNAGFDRVDRWRKRYGNVSDDEFIEMIPFSETRVYVKNILRNYFYYKFYHGPK